MALALAGDMLAAAEHHHQPWATLPKADILTELKDTVQPIAVNTLMSGQGQPAYRESQALISSNQHQRQPTGHSMPNGFSGIGRVASLC